MLRSRAARIPAEKVCDRPPAGRRRHESVARKRDAASGEGSEAYFLFADRMAAPTMSFVEGAAAVVFGTGFFGFLASRFPCFFSVAMVASFDRGCIIARMAVAIRLEVR